MRFRYIFDSKRWIGWCTPLCHSHVFAPFVIPIVIRHRQCTSDILFYQPFNRHDSVRTRVAWNDSMTTMTIIDLCSQPWSRTDSHGLQCRIFHLDIFSFLVSLVNFALEFCVLVKMQKQKTKPEKIENKKWLKNLCCGVFWRIIAKYVHHANRVSQSVVNRKPKPKQQKNISIQSEHKNEIFTKSKSLNPKVRVLIITVQTWCMHWLLAGKRMLITSTNLIRHNISSSDSAAAAIITNNLLKSQAVYKMK